MEEQKIILISYGYFEKDFIGRIAAAVSGEFHLPASFEISYLDLNPYYNPSRRQYDGLELMRYLDTTALPDPVKTVGLFSVDLFIPVLTYIFGQAVLNGRSGIASTYRLRNELYGLRRNEVLLSDRFKKEVIHELGHTFGLIHCHEQDCVMRASTYVEDIDQKGMHLCNRCRSLLPWV